MPNRSTTKLFLSLFLIFALTACLPGSSSDGTTVIDQDEVATIVAATLQAELAKSADTQGETEPDLPQEPRLLPHSLYYLSSENNAHQLWRIEADGATTQMLSPPGVDMSDYDVSSVDGSVAYVSENSLNLITSEGGETRLLVDASSADSNAEDYYYRQVISSPRFSPDGNTLAYALNGIWLLDLDSGDKVHLLENELEELESGAIFPGELYFPESWSPNGDNLLIAVSYLEAGTLAFMDPSSGELTEILASGIVCCQTRWAPDNRSVLVASPYIGLIEPGLWRYDANTGAEIVLIEGSESDSVFNFVGWPLQLDNGDLFYFYSSTAGIPEGDIPLLMMRSVADGTSDRQQVRSDSLIIREALWADDGSLALIVQSQQGSSGSLILAKIDGSPLLILANDAQQLRWGP